MPLIQPILAGDALLNDIRTANQQDGHFRLWWLGQSGFLLQWNGHHLLLDPYLSDSLTRKYANTATPHVRMTALPVEPGQLGFIDVVTSSHSHTDHMDAETLLPLFAANPGMSLVIPEAERETVMKKLAASWPAMYGLDDGGAVEIGGFRVNGVAAAHETVERDAEGRCRFLGFVIQFGPWTIYHSGDTVLHPALAGSLKQFRIDVAMLPVNGRGPERKVAGNLNAREAAWLGRKLGTRTVIPWHYDMFTFNTAPVAEFVAAADEAGLTYHVLRCGERWESARLGSGPDHI